MRLRVLLTGGTGFVGENIVQQSDPEWEIHGVARHAGATRRPGLHWHAADLEDRGGLERLFADVRPEVVIHTAALSDIDTCEANLKLAERINVGITGAIAELCRRHEARLIYLSTDSIFDGEKGGYEETDPPSPVNVYGRTKVAAERVVMEEAPWWVIVRPSLVMGLPVGERGNSFLWKMIQSLKRGEQVAFPAQEIRSPVNVITLSRALVELAERPLSGHFHLSGNDSLSRHEMAVRICRRLGYSGALVVDKPPSIATGRARRPRDVSLSNLRASRILRTPMVGLDAGIDLVIENKGSKEL